MKFLCDRCKTRYSIGDERVRGKILKIRCKNCANVITVREGMPELEAVVDAAAPRRSKTTTEAPAFEAPAAPNGTGTKPGALVVAFANAMSKPPPALEEEWYVSIDGDQSGPFSLAEAQRWIGSKVADAELHCWSEGFDDWLPVDKVSHFRGLRKKAAPPMPAGPPPLPRITGGNGNGSGPARALASAPRPEEEPKPLFAATMASLEKSASAASMSSGGAAALRGVHLDTRTPIPSTKPFNGGRPIVPATANTPVTARGVGLRGAPLVAAKPLTFDASETQAEAPALDADQPTRSEPEIAAELAARAKPSHLRSIADSLMRPDSLTRPDQPTAAPNDAFLDALAEERKDSKLGKLAKVAKVAKLEKLEKVEKVEELEKVEKVEKANQPMLSLASMAASSPIRAEAPPSSPMVPDPRDLPADDDMDIGEVSRVVKLADLVRPPARATAAATKRATTVGGRTSAIGRVTGPVAKINGTGTVPLIAAAVDALPGANPPLGVEPIIEPPPEKQSRRGLIVLLVGAALLLGAAAVLLVMKLNTTEDVTGLGGQYQYNPERPDNPIAKRPGDPTPGSNETQNPFIPKPPLKLPVRPPTQGSQTKIIDPPAGNSLKSDEIEAMARSTSGTTTACFRRASKGADDIILADVKKIRVAFHINPNGTVAQNSVDLSEKRSVTLSACIQRMVAGWRFRPNAGGDFGFVFAKTD